jgi:hypothetical protein
MADPSPQDTPSEQDSLFGSSRRTSTQADVQAPSQGAADRSGLAESMIVAPEDIDHEPTEKELQRNRDRFEVELEVR